MYVTLQRKHFTTPGFVNQGPVSHTAKISNDDSTWHLSSSAVEFNHAIDLSEDNALAWL